MTPNDEHPAVRPALTNILVHHKHSVLLLSLVALKNQLSNGVTTKSSDHHDSKASGSGAGRLPEGELLLQVITAVTMVTITEPLTCECEVTSMKPSPATGLLPLPQQQSTFGGLNHLLINVLIPEEEVRNGG